MTSSGLDSGGLWDITRQNGHSLNNACAVLGEEMEKYIMQAVLLPDFSLSDHKRLDQVSRGFVYAQISAEPNILTYLLLKLCFLFILAHLLRFQQLLQLHAIPIWRGPSRTWRQWIVYLVLTADRMSEPPEGDISGHVWEAQLLRYHGGALVF
ncbi:hypothetical protein BDZ97DRAFT_1200711 [Flammula alnicola]|nr:hypothetical protein BDZ97DRAFT_1200711 [Flammula alnicola]